MLVTAGGIQHIALFVRVAKPRRNDMSHNHGLEMVLESKEDVELAKVAQRCIMSSLDHSKAIGIAIVGDDVERLNEMPILRLPPKVLRLFADLLGSLARGKPVAIIPEELDFTTQQAAMFLSVSRPYVIRLLNEGKIPHHMIGTHRRIRFEDVVNYKEARRKISEDALQDLANQAQELGMGY
ncbi:MAG: helix-turn-helix domain-containing protein [Burkholderiales bacterium]